MGFIYFYILMKKYRNKERKRTDKIRQYNISNSDIANYFGFSTVDTFNNSTSKPRYIQGIECIIEHIEEYNRKK